jgi:hypothetical protein
LRLVPQFGQLSATTSTRSGLVAARRINQVGYVAALIRGAYDAKNNAELQAALAGLPATASTTASRREPVVSHGSHGAQRQPERARPHGRPQRFVDTHRYRWRSYVPRRNGPVGSSRSTSAGLSMLMTKDLAEDVGDGVRLVVALASGVMARRPMTALHGGVSGGGAGARPIGGRSSTIDA